MEAGGLILLGTAGLAYLVYRTTRDKGSLGEYSWDMTYSGSSMPTDSRLPRGLRNNNPLNIKAFGFSWLGMVGQDEYGHAIFDTIEHGYRAAARDISHKAKRWGGFSIRKLTCTWAEANCNNYAAFVAGRVGVRTDQWLTIDGVHSLLPRIIHAMAVWENGTQYEGLIKTDEIRRGVSMI